MSCFSARTSWDRAPSRFAQALQHGRESGISFLDLTESNPTRCGFKSLHPGMLDALRSSGNLSYDVDARGLLSAREAVSEWICAAGVSIPPEDIFLTASTSESYTLLFRLLADPKGTILAPSPGYPLFPFLASLNDLNLHHYPLRLRGRWEIDCEALDSMFAKNIDALIAVNPNNPTGQDISGEEKEMLLKKLAAPGIPLIADEVFGPYAWGAERLASFAGTPEVLTFTLGGLSKAMAMPQMKLGWILVSGPEELKREACARLEILCDTYLSVNLPVQRALPGWLRQQPDVAGEIRERLLKNLSALDSGLETQSVFRRLPASGGWYVVLEGQGLEDEEFSLSLLEKQRILVQPGYLYDMPGDGFLVLSLLPEPDLFQEGLNALLGAAR